MAGISNNLAPIQIVYGFSSPALDVHDRSIVDDLKQRQQQLTSTGIGHEFVKNVHQQQSLLDTKPNVNDETQKKDQQQQQHQQQQQLPHEQTNAKGLIQTDDIAIPDVSSNEQILYFTSVNRNGNVKGNYN